MVREIKQQLVCRGTVTSSSEDGSAFLAERAIIFQLFSLRTGRIY